MWVLLAKADCQIQLNSLYNTRNTKGRRKNVLFNIIFVLKQDVEQRYVGIVQSRLMTNVMENIFSKQNMLEAASKVGKKKSSGVDDIPANMMKQYIGNNHRQIYKELLTEAYIPNKVLYKEIKKNDGKSRPIAIATGLDRVIQTCIYNYICPLFEPEMSEYSYGFRKNKNCTMAVHKLVEYLDNGYEWIITVDLQDFFNHIGHDKVLFKLEKKIADKRLLSLINRYLKITYIKNHKEYKNFDGCPQGSNIAPLLANIVLSDVDIELESRGHPFLRYADDIFIMCKSEASAIRTLRSITYYIETKCKLQVNSEKSNIRHIGNGISILGFFVYKDFKRIHVVAKKESVQTLKKHIKEVCSQYPTEEIVRRINELLRGWIGFYGEAEIGLTTRRLDLFIKKKLKQVEKRIGNELDKQKLLSCHELYKEKMRLYKDKSMDGHATTKKCNPIDDNMLCQVRSPPIQQ